MVGGAVRDSLLGLPVQDRDWVVVGSTPQELVSLGYLPVGRDFPVFLHPDTKEEYALARTERKTARGYQGFEVQADPGVSLEQDLARRDITINSIAIKPINTETRGQFGTQIANSGDLIDPYGGQRDLQARVLRHVTDAFREDPVRILRVARFAARFSDFSVAPETQQLMQAMVASGEADALVAERVWQELARGLMEATPERLFDVLRHCGALARLMPEVNQLWLNPDPTGPAAMAALARAAQQGAPLPVRLACLCHALGAEALKTLCDRWRVPLAARALAELVAREYAAVASSAALDAEGLLQLLQRCDAFRRPERFADVLQACECISAAGQSPRLQGALAAGQSIVTQLIATKIIANKPMNTVTSSPNEGEMIAQAIHTARRAAIAEHTALPVTAPPEPTPSPTPQSRPPADPNPH